MKLLLVVAALVASGSLHAALIDRGGGFIYDDYHDITWLADANINGAADWFTQAGWAASLSVYDPVRNTTWDDWRLPRVGTWPGTEPQECAADHGISGQCGNVNELASLFGSGVHNINHLNPGPFVNLQSGWYWSADLCAAACGAPPSYWAADSVSTWQQGHFALAPNYAFAVRDGDVGVVPVPTAGWLFASALGALSWWRRRRAR